MMKPSFIRLRLIWPAIIAKAMNDNDGTDDLGFIMRLDYTIEAVALNMPLDFLYYMQTISIIGIGRVGLPLALAFAQKGCKVYGVDVNEEHIAKVNSGEMPFIEEGAQPLLNQYIGTSFFATIDLPQAVQASDVIILTLGTPVDEHLNPIFDQLESALKTMMPYLKEGHLIVLRSTVSPGTTEHIQRLIQRETRFLVGRDIFLAFCPERIAQGKSLDEIYTLPQIVGGVDPQSGEKASSLFKLLTPDVLVSDARSCELGKLYCNMYRYINFAIANEFMMIAQQHERDIYEVLRLVNTGYKRGGLKQPGFTAGPCLYKDGFFFVNKTPFAELITTAWKINESVPAYLIEQIKLQKNLQNAKVVILGLSFKKNIDDNRNSLSYKAKKIFLAQGAQVTLHDPFLKDAPLNDVLRDADVVLLAMNHDVYASLSLEMLKGLVRGGCIVCDIWNLLGTGKVLNVVD